MSGATLAALFVILSWWLGTALVLRVVWRSAGSRASSLVGSSVVAVAGLAAAIVASGYDTPFAAYVGFAGALATWGWHEVTFLLGSVTGPRKAPCPPDATGWERFRLATATLIHHELALALTLALLCAATWGAPNQVATWSFAVLWVMRLSAKLNLFLGVRNVSVELVPAQLRYLATYFRRARLNPLMPFSLGASAVLAVKLASVAWLDAGTVFEATASGLVASLVALAWLEHVFLAIPLPDAWLWRWLVPESQLANSPQVAVVDVPIARLSSDPRSAHFVRGARHAVSCAQTSRRSADEPKETNPEGLLRTLLVED